jgi:hypothetical protein
LAGALAGLLELAGLLALAGLLELAGLLRVVLLGRLFWMGAIGQFCCKEGPQLFPRDVPNVADVAIL